MIKLNSILCTISYHNILFTVYLSKVENMALKVQVGQSKWKLNKNSYIQRKKKKQIQLFGNSTSTYFVKINSKKAQYFHFHQF